MLLNISIKYYITICLLFSFVKRYAVRTVKIRQYAVRRVKIRQYAVRKGEGECPPHICVYVSRHDNICINDIQYYLSN